MILLPKFENERIMFSLDFGDILPWASTITATKITVEVSSGVDPQPQLVFASTYSITGTVVTYQLRQGLPGVIYKLLTAVAVGGEWFYKEVFLAITPSQAVISALYPLTRIFTSLPYDQFYEDPAVVGLEFLSGVMDTVLVEGTAGSDSEVVGLAARGGEMKEPGTYLIQSDAEVVGLGFLSGVLKASPEGTIDSDEAAVQLIFISGVMKIPPTGTEDADAVTVGLTFQSGEMKVP